MNTARLLLVYAALIVIPYRQAYAICDARALNAADYAPHHCWGLIGCAVRKAERDEHRDAVLRGCLAEYGYY